MSVVAEWAAAVVAVATPLGTAAVFVWKKVEARFTGIEAKLDECQQREAATLEHRGVQLTVIELLWQKIEQLDPGSSVLTRAKKLLDDLKQKNDDATHTD